MELTLPLVIQAILTVCQNDRRIFTPSSVRKMIQRLDRTAAREDATLVSAKLQPHLKTLSRCECIELSPTTQVRNRPWKLKDRVRLQTLQGDLGLIHQFSTNMADLELDQGELDGVGGEATVAGKVRMSEEIAAVRDELLDSLDEHATELQESMEAEVGKLTHALGDLENRMIDRLANLQQQIEFIKLETEQSLARIDWKLSSLCSLFAPEALKRVSGSEEKSYRSLNGVLNDR
jgi:hypothetical protein